jgi:hypothetical protein
MVDDLAQIEFHIASEEELNGLLEGRSAKSGYPWPSTGTKQRIPKGSFGVLTVTLDLGSNVVRPIAIIVDQGGEARLFSRFSQVRSDLSPLSSWLHVLSQDDWDRLHAPVTATSFNGFEAAWAGLAVAEAAILSRRPSSQLKLMACLATQSFAIARALGLWGVTNPTAVLERFNVIAHSVRKGPGTTAAVRGLLDPIWSSLTAATMRDVSRGRPGSIARALIALHDARSMGVMDHDPIKFCLDLPETAILDDIDEMTPESRLKFFDHLVDGLRREKTTPERRLELCFFAAYIATFAAGGASSFGIAEDLSDEIPEIMAYAYIIGGVGELRSWAGAFNGLGRLISREMTRSFNLIDGPVADFSVDEAHVLVDAQLRDPLVLLKLKQSRVAAAALYPGVNVQVPFAENIETTKATAGTPVSSERDRVFESFADALLPYLMKRLAIDGADVSGEKPRRGGRKNKQQKLNL